MSLPSKPLNESSISELNISQLFAQGFALHQQGQLSQAQAIYDQVLQNQSTHFDALQLLGVIAIQTGQYQRAIELFTQATTFKPDYAVAYSNRGIALKELGRFEEALVSYDQALASDPDFADAYNNRGMVLFALGRFEEALASFDQAIGIKPDHADSYNNRGNVLKELARMDEALNSYDQAITIKPKYAQAHNNRGIALKELGRFEEALASYDQAISIQPNYADAYSNLGNTLFKLNRFDQALASYNQAIALNPGKASYYNNQANTFNALKLSTEALASYDQAISIDPNYAEAYSNRGDALQEMGRLEESLASYDQAITIKPDYAEAYNNYGVAFKELRRFDEAVVCFEKALKLNPKRADADAYLQLSFLNLLLGNFKQGWSGYEWRWKNKSLSLFKDQRDFSVPLWLGEQSLKGKTILLHAEQGLGDTLQFCRYADLVAQLGAKMILEVQPPLLNLLANLEGVHQIVVRGDPLPAFDYHCPLMSLPLAFKTDLHSIPAATQYIHSDPTKLAQWQTLLGPKTKPRIGLVWSSASAFKGDGKRSLALSELLQALPTEGFEYICLQKEIKESDQQTLRLNPQIQFFGDQLNDFTDTAALTNCVDLVLSTCTSVPHLAGALGKPTWVMIPYVPDWRWLLDREDSPWYPSIKLFRQPSLGNWKSVFERVKADLIGMG